MTESRPCDGCGQPLFVFEGFDNLTTCSECYIARERAEIPDEIKAAEWLEVMKRLDYHSVELSVGSRRLTLSDRLERFLDQ